MARGCQAGRARVYVSLPRLPNIKRSLISSRSRPQLVRVEVVVVELDVELEPVEGIVIDLVARGVERQRQHRKVRDRVEEDEPLAAAGDLRLAAGRELALDAFERCRRIRAAAPGRGTSPTRPTRRLGCVSSMRPKRAIMLPMPASVIGYLLAARTMIESAARASRRPAGVNGMSLAAVRMCSFSSPGRGRR